MPPKNAAQLRRLATEERIRARVLTKLSEQPHSSVRVCRASAWNTSRESSSRQPRLGLGHTSHPEPVSGLTPTLDPVTQRRLAELSDSRLRDILVCLRRWRDYIDEIM